MIIRRMVDVALGTVRVCEQMMWASELVGMVLELAETVLAS